LGSCCCCAPPCSSWWWPCQVSAQPPPSPQQLRSLRWQRFTLEPLLAAAGYALWGGLMYALNTGATFWLNYASPRCE
jgi:hypothetical protein